MSKLARIRITRAAPLTTVQDSGRFGALAYGIAASGPMDQFGWGETRGGSSGIEFTRAGIDFTVLSGMIRTGFGGGHFELAVNGRKRHWPVRSTLKQGDRISVTPGSGGLYGYMRFAGDIDVPLVIGSRATNTIARLGGLNGRPLQPGDELDIVSGPDAPAAVMKAGLTPDTPFRFVWGIHADLFDARERHDFISNVFHVSHRLDRMGIRLEDREGVFSHATHLSLVSDAVVPGDVQILGDGTPIVLMRDHQPTGGYPRIATLLTPEISRFAQMRPGAALRFAPVSLQNASDKRGRTSL